MTTPFQSLQNYFKYYSLDCSKNLTDKRGICFRFWSALTLRIFTLVRYHSEKICFTLNSSNNEKKIAEQKPKNKVMSITRVQARK